MDDFVDPITLSGEELDQYLSRGWFRSKQSLFTESLHIDQEISDLVDIYWLRFPVDEIRPHASHKRIRKKNRRFRIRFQDQFALSEEDDVLFRRYRQSVPFDIADSVGEVLYEENRPNIFDSKAFRLYDEDKLIAGSIFDIGRTSAASIVQFYDPAYRDYSPGKYLILLTIDYMKQSGLTLYYPGYVISTMERFHYKLFLGYESAYYYSFDSTNWQRFTKEMLEYRRMISFDDLD